MSHCNNIRQFSSAVYLFLTEVFSYRLTFSELGLTDHLLLDLARYSRLTGLRTVEIYKMSWRIESVYGNDIDLFIQNNSGTYNWYALQAKVMSFNGAFKDLKFNRTAALQQWDRLLSHEAIFGSKTYYLLYSGQSLQPPPGLPVRTDCLGIPPINELGLGIVETNVIRNIRTTIIRPAQQFYFRHVFPSDIDSIRKLFCCFKDLPETTKQYERSEINTREYQQIYFTDSIGFEDKDLEIEPTNPTEGNAPVRIIISIDEQDAKS